MDKELYHYLSKEVHHSQNSRTIFLHGLHKEMFMYIKGMVDCCDPNPMD